MRNDRQPARVLAAYALGAVGGREARSIRHAIEDRRLRREADAHRDTVERLLARFDPVEPDPGVWDRIEAVIGDEHSPGTRRQSRFNGTLLINFASDQSVDLATVASGLAANPASVTRTLADPVTGDPMATVVVGTDGLAVLTAGGLPPLDPASTYQLWAVVDGRVVSAGLLGSEPTVVALRLEASPSALAVTVEFAGVVVSDQQPVAVWAQA